MLSIANKEESDAMLKMIQTLLPDEESGLPVENCRLKLTVIFQLNFGLVSIRLEMVGYGQTVLR